MTENVENLILTQLRALRDDFTDVKNRLANIEAIQANKNFVSMLQAN